MPAGGPSGCSLKHIYGSFFRRRAPRVRRSVSSTSVNIPIDGTARPTTKRRSYSDVSSRNAVTKANLDYTPIPEEGERPLPVVPVVVKQIVSSKPIQNQNGTNKSKVNRPQQPRKAAVQNGTGISFDLDSFVSDPQRTNGGGKFVRASSSNVMLFGELGNLGGGRRQSGGNNYLTTPTPPTPKPKPSRPKSLNQKPTLCRALSKRYTADELKEKGNEEYRNGKYTEALMFYEQAINTNPTKASYYSNKAAALTGLGQLLDAVDQCKEAIRIEPSYRKAHCRIGTLYLR